MHFQAEKTFEKHLASQYQIHIVSIETFNKKVLHSKKWGQSPFHKGQNPYRQYKSLVSTLHKPYHP
jgi:hypothetical protein